MNSAASASEIVASDPPMVARDAELAQILAVISSVMTGSGRCLMLVGEPGIGKTTLAPEALRGAAGVGASTTVGRCFEQHSTVPFFPFAEADGNPFCLLPSDEPDTVASALDAAQSARLIETRHSGRGWRPDRQRRTGARTAVDQA